MALVRKGLACVFSNVGKSGNWTVTYALPRGTRREREHITTAQTTLEESIATFVNRVVTYSPPPVVTSHLVIGSLLSLIEYYCFGMRVFKTLNKHMHIATRWRFQVQMFYVTHVSFLFFSGFHFCAVTVRYFIVDFCSLIFRIHVFCVYPLINDVFVLLVGFLLTIYQPIMVYR